MKACMSTIFALGCALALAGCGQSETSPASATAAPATSSPHGSATSTQLPEPSPTSELSQASSAPEPASVPVPATKPATSAQAGPSTTTVTDEAASVPERDTGEYGDALINAWTSGDASALERYANEEAAAALQKATPSKDLLRTACESNMCSYADEAGRRVTLTFDEEKIAQGARRAVTDVRIGS